MARDRDALFDAAMPKDRTRGNLKDTQMDMITGMTADYVKRLEALVAKIKAKCKKTVKDKSKPADWGDEDELRYAKSILNLIAKHDKGE